ncbi:MAG: PQQ-dependent sugar dehydrogenase [Planctomycetes bacterium]|nr:PQQ-dependent sugar dehydrogenase [Planctomycetota bacterium]
MFQLLRSSIAWLVIGCAGACAGGESPQAEAQTAQDSPTTATAPDESLPTVRLSRAFPRLTFTRPIYLTHAGDGSDRLFVVEQRGRILVFQNRSDVTAAQEFLDIRPIVRMRHNEEGLLALAFHPKYAENGRFYVYYTASDPRRGVLSRFSVSVDDPGRADPSSEQVILEVEQPWGNHNGSTVLFGPDGYLYMSLGDGGAANDPHNNGQDLSTLLATIIRIDVDRQDPDRNYAIPKDNPFVNRPGARGEIWAYGLRNIWRMSFDRETGDLWGGDIGQGKFEEIDLIVKGGNYGWNIREGKHDFRPRESAEPLIDPVVEYGRREGLSVTGGYVYRGDRVPQLRGAYIYADYVSRKIWGLRYEGGKVTMHREIFSGSGRAYVTSFGEDAAGELYICAFDSPDGRGGSDGRIYRLNPR